MWIASKEFLHRSRRRWTTYHLRCICKFLFWISRCLFNSINKFSIWWSSWVTFLNKLIHWFLQRLSFFLFTCLSTWLLSIIFTGHMLIVLVLYIILISLANPFINKSFILFYTPFFVLWNLGINFLDFVLIIWDCFAKLNNERMIENLGGSETFLWIELDCL